MNTHIILISFKSAGKTTVGLTLSAVLKLQFLDLDRQIEKIYRKKTGQKINCRNIMSIKGETFFRRLENVTLKKILKTRKSAIIALGGGAPLQEKNQILLKNHFIIHIVAAKKTVFDRIKKQGRPSFFPQDKDMRVHFNKLWKERMPVYKKLADVEADLKLNRSRLHHP